MMIVALHETKVFLTWQENDKFYCFSRCPLDLNGDSLLKCSVKQSRFYELSDSRLINPYLIEDQFPTYGPLGVII
jgi:hypothetical protein